MGPCGVGNRWQGYVFDEERRKTGSDNSVFRDFPNCGPDFTRAQYDQQVIRYYEDGTQLSRAVNGGMDPIDAPLAARMTRCGVDLVGSTSLPGATRGWPHRCGAGRRGSPRRAAPARCSAPTAAGRRAPAPSATAWPAATRPATGSYRARG